MDRRIYAGIGSRETPADAQMIMRLLAGRMEKDGWLLRSGGAKGADTAFESGVMDPRHRAIYLPGPSFNGRRAGSGGGYFDSTQLPGWQQALETVSRYHPAPDRLSPFAVNLMARNAMQVLGPSLDQPANMIIAWTPAPGGVPTGGTAQALRMATDLGIPVRNLWEPQALEGVRRYLGLDLASQGQRQRGRFLIDSTAPPGLGRQLSPLVARLSDGRTIEQAYQQAKGYPDWRAGKGRPARDPGFDYQGVYKQLYQQFADENPDLMAQLRGVVGHSDLVHPRARTSQSPATVLTEILSSMRTDQPGA